MGVKGSVHANVNVLFIPRDSCKRHQHRSHNKLPFLGGVRYIFLLNASYLVITNLAHVFEYLSGV